MLLRNFENRILLGITGTKEKDWQGKLNDLSELKIEEVVLFLERFDETQREKIYQALLNSSIKRIPLCHIRNDMRKEELVFLKSKFRTEYFTIHEDSFVFLDKWKGFYKKLYLEMNIDNYVSFRKVTAR